MNGEPDLEAMYAQEWAQYRQIIGGGQWHELPEESREWFRGRVSAEEVRRRWRERREALIRVGKAAAVIGRDRPRLPGPPGGTGRPLP